jgi:hypothetical protein
LSTLKIVSKKLFKKFLIKIVKKMFFYTKILDIYVDNVYYKLTINIGTTIANTKITAIAPAMIRLVFLLFMFIMAVHPFSKGYYI